MSFSFKNLPIIYILLILSSLAGCGSTTKKIRELQELDGIYFVKGTQVKYTGNYIAFGDKSKIKILEANFKNGKFDGNVIAWGEDGAKREEKVFKDGLLNGTSTTWIGNNLKISGQDYQNGKLNGKSILWNKNGVKITEVVYKDNLQNGITSKWNDNGIKVFEAQFKNDKLEGKTTKWDKNGLKLSEVEFKNGMRNGISKAWFKDGSKETESIYKDDKLNGRFIEWDQYGNKLSDVIFNDDSPINGKLTEFYSNRVKKSEIEYKDGKRNGKALFWKENGVKNGEYEYVDDYLKGKEIVRTENNLKPSFNQLKRNDSHVEKDSKPEEIKNEIKNDLNSNVTDEDIESILNNVLSKILRKSTKTLGSSIFIDGNEAYITVYNDLKKLGFVLNEEQVKVLKTSIDGYKETLKKPIDAKENPNGLISSNGNFKTKKVLVRNYEIENDTDIKEATIFFQVSNQGEYKDNLAFIIVIPKIKNVHGLTITEGTQRCVFLAKDIEKISKIIETKMDIDKQLLQEIEENK